MSATLTLRGAGSTAVKQVMKLSEVAFASLNPQYEIEYEAIGYLFAKFVFNIWSRTGLAMDKIRNSKSTYNFVMSETPLLESDYTNDPSFQVYLCKYFNTISCTGMIPRIQALNPTYTLPGKPIHILVGSGVSGTSFDFTFGLQHFDKSWTTVSPDPNWPDQASDTNFFKVESSKVSTEMMNIDYSISYLQDEAAGCSVAKYAVQLENTDGNFVLLNSTTTNAAIDAIGFNFDSQPIS
eukprot:gene7946-12413_t